VTATDRRKPRYRPCGWGAHTCAIPNIGSGTVGDTPPGGGNGDSYLSLDLPRVEAAFAESGCPALMTVMHNRNRWEASNVVYQDGRVIVYDKTRPEAWRDRMEWIDYGFAVISRQAILDGVAPGASADLSDLMRDLSLSGRLAGFEVTERFYEIGSPQGLADLERHLSSGAA